MLQANSIFSMTFSNYGKYLNSNVFMQKSRQLGNSSSNLEDEVTENAEGNQRRSRSIVPPIRIQRPKNDIKIEQPVKPPGTAVFRSIERGKARGFCHFYEREGKSEIKYQPKYDLVLNKAPAFSISKANNSFTTIQPGSTKSHNEQIVIPQFLSNDKEEVNTQEIEGNHVQQELINVNALSYLSLQKEGYKYTQEKQPSPSKGILEEQKQQKHGNEFEHFVQEKCFGSNKTRFDLQLEKQTQRASLIKSPISQDESRFNNFQFMKTDDSKAHAFDSYTSRKVFQPRQSSPFYDINKVNFDRLLLNDKHNKGKVSLDQQRIHTPFSTKHEIVNGKDANHSFFFDFSLKDKQQQQKHKRRVRPITASICPPQHIKSYQISLQVENRDTSLYNQNNRERSQKRYLNTTIQ